MDNASFITRSPNLQINAIQHALNTVDFSVLHGRKFSLEHNGVTSKVTLDHITDLLRQVSQNVKATCADLQRIKATAKIIQTVDANPKVSRWYKAYRFIFRGDETQARAQALRRIYSLAESRIQRVAEFRESSKDYSSMYISTIGVDASILSSRFDNLCFMKSQRNSNAFDSLLTKLGKKSSNPPRVLLYYEEGPDSDRGAYYLKIIGSEETTRLGETRDEAIKKLQGELMKSPSGYNFQTPAGFFRRFEPEVFDT